MSRSPPRGRLTVMTKVYPLVALAAIVSGVAGIVFGQLGPDARLDPLHTTAGEFAVAGRGGVTALATAVIALGSLALLAGLRAAGAPVRGTPERLLLVWSGALLAAPFGAGPVSRYVTVAAFACLPAAGALLVPRLAGDQAWRPVARAVEWLGLGGGLGVAAAPFLAVPRVGGQLGPRGRPP